MNLARKIGLMALLALPLIYRQIGPVVADLRETQEAFFGYGVICLSALFIGNIWLGAFLILNMVLFIWNGQQVGAVQVINILLGCLLFAFSRVYFKKNKFSDLYPWILGILAINLVWMNLQLHSIDPIFIGQTNDGVQQFRPFNDPVGFFGIKMANGIYIASVIPILAVVNPILGVLLIIPLWLMRSSAVALAVALSALLFTYYLYRRVFFGLLLALPVALGIFIAYDLHDDSRTFTARFPVWHSAIRHLFGGGETLWGLVGYGPDSYRNYTPHKDFKFGGDEFYNHGIIHRQDNGFGFSYYSPQNDKAKIQELTKNIGNTQVAQGRLDEWDNPHSEPINVLFQTGLIGFALIFCLIREMFLRFKYALKDKELVTIASCLVVYFVTSLFHFPFEIARTAAFGMILMGAFYAKTDA